MAQDERMVDLREIGTALRRGWYVIALGAVLGAGLGFLGLERLPERYEGKATVLVRSDQGGASSLLSRLGGLAELMPGMGGMGGSELDTEIEILRSRSLIGELVDSMVLQVEVLSPDAIAASRLVRSVTVPNGYDQARWSFERRGEGFLASGPAGRVEVGPDGVARLGSAVVRLAPAIELPDRFTLQLSDREDAITRVHRALNARRVTADVAELSFRAGDPETAAALPNALLGRYLQRRQTTDRGLNQNRYDFLVGQTDSIAVQLADAELNLRLHQESSGIVDPAVYGQANLERAMTLRGELETIEIENRALRRVLDQSGSGAFTVRDIAAYPSFLRNAAINDVLSRLLELETRRVELLQRRTEQDPDVVALTESVRHLEGQLRELSRAYLDGLGQQQAELTQELSSYGAELARLPGHVEQSFRLEREVRRLSETLIAMQTQLVQTRLMAIGEGGEVRQIDAAVPPRKPVFPQPILLLFGGLVGGAFFGAIGAVTAGLMRRRIREPWEVELAAGIPAVTFDRARPLALGVLGQESSSTVLVPVATRSDPADAVAVGQRFVETASLQGREAVLVDLSEPMAKPVPRRVPGSTLVPANGDGAASSLVLELPSGPISLPVYEGSRNGHGGNGTIQMLVEVERRYPHAVAVLPKLDDPISVSALAGGRQAVLVARSGALTRSELLEALRTIERMGGSVVGVVLHPDTRRFAR